MKKVFFMAHAEARRRAMQAVQDAQEGWCVTVSEPKRNLEQSAKFHAICGDIAKSGKEWAGKKRTAIEWKFLLVSGHSVATKEGAEVVPGLEGEFINLRESTASMGVKRASSLIEYALAFCAMNGIVTNDSTA